MAADRQSEEKRRAPRIDLEREVSLTFKEFRGFLHEMSGNLSTEGMFLESSSPKPPGAIFDFEIELADETPLVQGIAKVVWIREEATGPDRPAGMGVRFLALSGRSREVIGQLVAAQLGEDADPALPPTPPSGGPERRNEKDEEPPASSAETTSRTEEIPVDTAAVGSEAADALLADRAEDGRRRPPVSGTPTTREGRRPSLAVVLLLLLLATAVVVAAILLG